MLVFKSQVCHRGLLQSEPQGGGGSSRGPARSSNTPRYVRLPLPCPLQLFIRNEKGSAACLTQTACSPCPPVRGGAQWAALSEALRGWQQSRSACACAAGAPFHDFKKTSARPLPAGQAVPVRFQLMPTAYTFAKVRRQPANAFLPIHSSCQDPAPCIL